MCIINLEGRNHSPNGKSQKGSKNIKRYTNWTWGKKKKKDSCATKQILFWDTLGGVLCKSDTEGKFCISFSPFE